MQIRIIGIIGASLLAFLSVACEEPAHDNANVNKAANSNVAVNANTPAPSPTADTARRAPTREDYERDKDRYQREAKGAGRKIGTGINDGWLWVKTRFDLAAADDLRDSTVDVDVDNGVVTLTGTVASAAQKTKAESVAKTVEGVKSVKNMLKVAADNSNAAKAKANANKPK